MNTINLSADLYLRLDTIAMPERKERFAMLCASRSIAASHGSTTLFKDFHRSYAAGPGLILYSLVEVVLSAQWSSVGVTSPFHTKLRSHRHYVRVLLHRHANASCVAVSF